jgi:integrase
MKAGYTKNNKHKVYSKSTIKLLEVALNKFYLLEGKPNPFSFNEIEKRTQKEFLKQNGSKTTEHIKYKTLSKNEYERILNYISNGNHRVRNRQKLRNAVLLMLAFGLRVSELTRLEKSDFTLNGKVKLHVKPSKRGKARDTYYIFGDKYKDEILSIIENEEFDFNIHTVSKQIERIKEVLGISQLSTHSFRHTFATTYLTKSGSLESLAKLLGHSDTKTTQIYGKIINQRIEQELDYLTPAEIEE